MEGIVVWIIIIVGWIFIKNVFSKSDDEIISETIQDNPFEIKVKSGQPPIETGLELDCFNVEMKGMVNHPTDPEVKIILTLQDVTEDETQAGISVLSAVEAFSETKSRVFSWYSRAKTSPGGYYPDWTRYISIPKDFLIPPHKGNRKIKILVFVCDIDTEIDLGKFDDTSKIRHYASKIVTLNYKEPGYMDEVINKSKVEDLTIKLGMSMAAVDDHLEQKELDVIKNWAKGIVNLLDEDRAAEKKKHFSKFIKETYSSAKSKKISLSTLVKEFNDVASKSQKYTAIQLLLDISSADGSYSKSEDTFINKIAKTTGIDLKTFKEMRNKIVAKVDKLEISEKPTEESFGLTEDMDDSEKCKILRKEYTKWNSQTTQKDPKRKKRAKEMVKTIANLRKQYNC